LGWRRQLLQGRIGNKALVDARKGLLKAYQNGFQFRDDGRELLEGTPALQFLGVVRGSLNAKDAFAFGIDLQRQLAAVQLEDRQILHRSLDRDFPLG